jgi:small-conductance mechanosensitive channel
MTGVFALQDISGQVNDPLPIVDDLINTSDVTWWSVLFAVLTVAAGWLLARIVRRGLRRYLKRWPELPVYITNYAARAAGWLIMFVAIVYALSLLGFDMAPVVIGMLIVIVVVILSGRSMLEDFGAGVILQTRAPFRAGDQISTLEHLGTVEKLTARAVEILTLDGERVYVPNNTVLNNPIVNYTEHGARRTVEEVGVRYGTDLDRAQRVLLDAIASVSRVLEDPAPEVLAEEFDDSSIDFEVHYWHDPEILAGLRVRDEVTRAINRSLKEAGIVIAFPQRTLWWGQDSDQPGDTSGDPTGE